MMDTRKQAQTCGRVATGFPKYDALKYRCARVVPFSVVTRRMSTGPLNLRRGDCSGCPPFPFVGISQSGNFDGHHTKIRKLQPLKGTADSGMGQN